MVLICLIAAAVLVAADQLVKYAVALSLPFEHFSGQPIPIVPHVIGLTHVHNTGGAWSLFSQYTWILAAISAAASVFILYLLLRRRVRVPMAVWSLALVLAGAVGNLIDRVLNGYVVDMFTFLFLPTFPVFNVADICVTVGGVLLCVYIFFFHEQRKGPIHGDHPSAP